LVSQQSLRTKQPAIHLATVDDILAAFYRDVASDRVVWTIRDADGIRRQVAGGRRAQPFWSTCSRVEKIVKTVPAYAGFHAEEIPSETFCSVLIRANSR